MPSICGVCENQCDKDGSEVMCAGSCGSFFHSKCIKGDLEGRKLRSNKDWKCKGCRIPTSLTNVSTTIDNDLLKMLTEEITNVRLEMNELRTSVQFMSDKIDSSNELMHEIKVEMSTLRKENEELKLKNLNLTSDVRDLKERVRSLEQYTRKNNVEISGVPETPNEDTLSLLKDIGKTIGVEVDVSHFNAAHRIPSFNRRRPPPIIVQFHQRIIKDIWIKKYKEKRNLSAKQVNPIYPDQRIYISDHLSPENKQFLAKLKAKCSEVGFKFAWTRDGKFFARKNEGDKCQKIDTVEDIERLK